MSRGTSALTPDADKGAFDRICDHLNPEWIEEALQATGTASVRKRRLPSVQVIWLVLGMALYRHRPIHELVQRLGLVLPGVGAPAKSGVAKARARVGPEPIRWLFEQTATKWAHESARRHAWRKLALYGLDGTTARVPDSDENRAHFGGSNSGRGDGQSGYPLARAVTLMALRSHLLAGMRFGPYATSELAYAAELWGQMPDDSLLIVDRLFLCAEVLVPIFWTGTNRHWLLRAKVNTAWTVVKRLGKGEQIVELKVSSVARAKNPALPKTILARAIRYQRRGFKPHWLLTSLFDPAVHPAKEVVELYHERWELELGFDEVKTEMLERQEAIRSQRPRGWHQFRLHFRLA